VLFFVEQARKLNAMLEGVVRGVLQVPEMEQVPYQTAEGQGWKRPRY
jgi:hypothetical protein